MRKPCTQGHDAFDLAPPIPSSDLSLLTLLCGNRYNCFVLLSTWMPLAVLTLFEVRETTQSETGEKETRQK